MPTEISIPARSSGAPARSISTRVTDGLAKIIALGGVATGSMNPMEADKATGNMKVTGSIFRDAATAPAIGRKIAAIAVLLACSPIKTMSAAKIRSNKSSGG